MIIQNPPKVPKVFFWRSQSFSPIGSGKYLAFPIQKTSKNLTDFIRKLSVNPAWPSRIQQPLTMGIMQFTLYLLGYAADLKTLMHIYQHL